MKTLALLLFVLCGFCHMVHAQGKMVKPGNPSPAVVHLPVMYDKADSNAKMKMMQPEQPKVVNANTMLYWKAASEQLENEAIEQTMIDLIKKKEDIIEQLKSRIMKLEKDNYNLRNPDGPAMAQQPLGIVQFFFPNLDFSFSDEEKAKKLLDAIQYICKQKPNGAELYASVIAPEKNIAAGDFHSLYKYRLQMVCLLIKND